MGHLKKIIKIIVNLITCFLLLILGLIIYGKIVITFTDNSYPNYFGYTFFEVASGSMEPTLQINDVILIKIGKNDLKKDDIIAFNVDDTIITHRILFIDGRIITVKGDNNNVVDKPITNDQVIGKVVKIFPELGIWKKVMTEPKILFGLFITLLLFDFALSYTDKDKSKNKKNVLVDEDKLAVEIPSEAPKKEENTKEKKVIESEKLLEFTRKIDIDEINKLLEETDYKLEKREINNIKREISKIEEKKEEIVIPNLNENEKKVIEYTMRLDLNEIQRRINSRVK